MDPDGCGQRDGSRNRQHGDGRSRHEQGEKKRGCTKYQTKQDGEWNKQPVRVLLAWRVIGYILRLVNDNNLAFDYVLPYCFFLRCRDWFLGFRLWLVLRRCHIRTCVLHPGLAFI